MADLNLPAGKTALLVMDCQQGIADSLTPAEREKVISHLSKAIAAARKNDVPVIYVVVQFREGYPEVSPRNVTFSAMKQSGRLREGQSDAQIVPQLSPRPGEPVCVKKRIGGFTGSDLEWVLNARGIETIVLTGISSLGVVESTARAGIDKDFRIVTLGDCCSDRDPEANEIALKWLLPRMGPVTTAADFIAAISR